LDAASKQKIEVTDNRRQLTDEQAYEKWRALQERLAKAGFKPHPNLAERSPFKAIEGEVVSDEAVKVPAGAGHSDPNTMKSEPSPSLSEPNFAENEPQASNPEQSDPESDEN
jgi:hypothetical protein